MAPDYTRVLQSDKSMSPLFSTPKKSVGDKNIQNYPSVKGLIECDKYTYNIGDLVCW